jgi:hypothetical protein
LHNPYFLRLFGEGRVESEHASDSTLFRQIILTYSNWYMQAVICRAAAGIEGIYFRHKNAPWNQEASSRGSLHRPYSLRPVEVPF